MGRPKKKTKSSKLQLRIGAARQKSGSGNPVMHFKLAGMPKSDAVKYEFRRLLSAHVKYSKTMHGQSNKAQITVSDLRKRARANVEAVYS